MINQNCGCTFRPAQPTIPVTTLTASGWRATWKEVNWQLITRWASPAKQTERKMWCYSTSITPCSPGIISGFSSTSARASLSSSTNDSFLTATSWGLNLLTCTTKKRKKRKREKAREREKAISTNTQLKNGLGITLFKAHNLSIKVLQVLYSIKPSDYLISKKSNIWTSCQCHDCEFIWILCYYVQCLRDIQMIEHEGIELVYTALYFFRFE